MTSHEFENSALPTLDALRDNPDALMQAEVLQAALSAPEQFAADPQKITPEEGAELASVREYARQQIVGPEFAVSTAREAAQRFVENIREPIQRSGMYLDNASQSVVNGHSKVQSVADLLPGARSGLGALREAIDGQQGQFMVDDARFMLSRVRQFDEDYGRVLAGARSDYEQAGMDTRGAMNTVQEGADAARRSVHVTEDASQDARHEAPLAAPELIDAVSTRGARTISEHATSCQQDVDQVTDGLKEVTVASGNLYEEVLNANRRISVLTDNLESLVSPRVISDEVQELSRGIYQLAEHGPMMATMLRDTVDRMQAMLNHIEHGVQQDNQLSATAATELGELKQKTASLLRHRSLAQ